MASASGNPKVFVVTPSLNQGGFIRATIESVLAQDYPNLAYFVADGGSTDDTLEILKSYGDRVRWVSGPDGGQAAAVALAWQQTDASIVAWLNSDDTYLPGAVSAAVDYLVTHPDVAMVYGNAWYTDELGHFTQPYPTSRFDPSLLVQQCFICQPSAFLRRAALEVIGLPDKRLRYCMDYDLWIRLSRLFEVHHLDRFLATSRLHRNNKTLSQTREFYREIATMLQHHYGYVDANWLRGQTLHEWKAVAARLGFLPSFVRRWIVDRRVSWPLHHDGWAGRRTLVTVHPDGEGRVTLHCDNSLWPHRRSLRIKVTRNAATVARFRITDRGPFELTFRLPDAPNHPATVVLEASHAFTPILTGSAWDFRSLAFRVLDGGSKCGSTSEFPSAFAKGSNGTNPL
jgi:glycosyltransferase involved in cell wall biosynthesis